MDIRALIVAAANSGGRGRPSATDDEMLWMRGNVTAGPLITDCCSVAGLGGGAVGDSGALRKPGANGGDDGTRAAPLPQEYAMSHTIL